MPSHRKEYESLLEAVPDALLAVDRTGAIRFVNELTELLFFEDREGLVGQSFETLVPGSHEQVHALFSDDESADPSARATGMAGDLNGRKGDGTEFPADIRLSQLDTEDGPLVIAAVRDMTDQKQALNTARSMIESSLDSLVSISPEGMITDVNEATVTITGVPRDHLVGTAFSDYFTDPEKANAIYQRVFADGMAVDYPLIVRHQSGSLTNVLYNASVYRDAGGKVLGVFAAARDVTKQMQAFESARSMIESSLDSLVSISPEGMITDVNEATAKVTGVPREQLIGTAFSDYFTDPEKANAIYQRVFAEGMAVDYPLTMRHRDGTLTDVLYNASVYRDAGDKVLGAFAAARDVTEQRKSQEIAQRMAALVENTYDAIIVKTLDGVITNWNPAAERLYGYSRQEITGRSITLLSPPNLTDEIQGILDKIGAGEHIEHLETLRIRKNGSVVPVSLTVSPIRDANGAISGASTIARDMTEIRHSAQSARSMIESSLDSLVSISPEGMITDLNEATVKVTGIPREQLIGTAFSNYFTEPEKANEIYQRVFAEGMAVDYPLTMRHLDGTLTDVLYNASVYRDAGGEVLGVFAAARDVTKQRQAQYARSLIEAGLDPLVTISPEGKITDVNEATVKVTGVPRDQLIGTDFSDYFTDPDKANEGYERVFAQGSVTDYPLTMRHREGRLREVLYNASVYRDAEGHVLGVFAAARDVTEQKMAQAEIAQQAKELDRLAELERFQKLTVGRELKMIELKKEIEFLRNFGSGEGGEYRDQH